ncbi:ATP phosphoribosyltransferase regulatory subunit, partial [Candidatus Parcubacteria bacterium]|nr:ATP phosphoribosyltransferase regulatory subunit [Candidatus Parcubacteria bacterium]
MGRRPKNKTIIKKRGKVKPPQLLRGMKDIIPQEQDYWNYVRDAAREIAQAYGFKRIDTPILENSALFVRATGKHTDIVEKEMFSFTDQGGEKVCLKPEATPGIVRAYIEHGMLNLPQPVKLYTIATLFRRERPQSGRTRQHHQFDLEIIGDKNPVIEGQLLLIAHKFYQEIGINVKIKINSLGCIECSPRYKENLTSYLKGKKAKLCPDCKKRLIKNPLRILDCKEEKCKIISAEAPQIVDWLCE